MPRVRPRRIGRLLLYGGLACGLGAAMQPPGFGARAKAQAEVSENHVLLGRAIVKKYLDSLPLGAPEDALVELAALPPPVLMRVLEWLTVAPEQRPLMLLASGIDAHGALHAALLEASLTGFNAAPLAELPRLFQQLPQGMNDPLRLRLLHACASRAGAENESGIELAMLAAAARHPDAGWEQVMTLVEAAAEARQTAAAIEVLQDWMDDPPAAHEQHQREARSALARLHLLDHQPAAAWALLEPVLNQDTPLEDACLDLAWAAAAAAGKTAQLVTPLETRLRDFPPHQLHWRELAEAPPPEPVYVAGLHRLLRACMAAGQEARALEMGLHLAWLEHPRHLLPVLPAAVRLARQREVLDLLDRLDEERPDPAAAHAFTLAASALAEGRNESARWLLEARLRRHPRDLAAARLLLRARADALPPMQAALLWRRHLRDHPGDSEAHHQLCELWQSAGQPRAAVNHLLALSPAQDGPSLRLRLAETAIEARHTPALVTALERLHAAGETLPEELRRAGADLLPASVRQKWAAALSRP